MILKFITPDIESSNPAQQTGPAPARKEIKTRWFYKLLLGRLFINIIDLSFTVNAGTPNELLGWAGWPVGLKGCSKREFANAKKNPGLRMVIDNHVQAFGVCDNLHTFKLTGNWKWKGERGGKVRLFWFLHFGSAVLRKWKHYFRKSMLVLTW